jgi:hypothetical protein
LFVTTLRRGVDSFAPEQVIRRAPKWFVLTFGVSLIVTTVLGVWAATLQVGDGGEGAPTPPPAAAPPPGPDGNGAPEPPTEKSLLEKVDERLASLPRGSVAFNTPSTLELGESAEVELLLSLRQSVERLKKQVAEVGEREGARVRVTEQMEATLTGVGFQIEAITPERQLLSSRDVTRWKWEVEPTRTGALRLHLTLTALIDVEGERQPRAIRTFERTLTIRVTWQDRVSGFVRGNWQWLWATLLPLAAAAWGALRATRKRRRKRAKGRKKQTRTARLRRSRS